MTQQYINYLVIHAITETPEIVCKATDHIKEMLEYVEKLVENGYAYETSTANNTVTNTTSNTTVENKKQN